MSTTFHISVREPTLVPVTEARAQILGTGRRPVNLDKLLAKSKKWARVEMAVSRAHPDVCCSTAEVFYARALCDAWTHANGAWGDEKKLAKNPVAKAFGGRLFDPQARFVEWRDSKQDNAYPCPLLFVRLDYSSDAVSTTFLVPEAWVKGIEAADFDCAVFGHHDSERQRAANWSFSIAARPVAGVERVKARGGVKKGYSGVAFHEGRLFAIDGDTDLVIELDADFAPKPVAWFTRSAAMTGIWAEQDSLFVAKKKAGIEVRGDKVVASPKTSMAPSYAHMQWLAAARELLPLDGEGGGVGGLVFATRSGDEEWLVTTAGLIGRAREGAWCWFIADVPNPTLGHTARGATLTDTAVVITGPGGLYEVPRAALDDGYVSPPG